MREWEFKERSLVLWLPNQVHRNTEHRAIDHWQNWDASTNVQLPDIPLTFLSSKSTILSVSKTHTASSMTFCLSLSHTNNPEFRDNWRSLRNSGDQRMRRTELQSEAQFQQGRSKEGTTQQYASYLQKLRGGNGSVAFLTPSHHLLWEEALFKNTPQFFLTLTITSSQILFLTTALVVNLESTSFMRLFR